MSHLPARRPLLAVLLPAALALGACSGDPDDAPEDVVEQVLEARTAGDCDRLEPLLTAPDVMRCSGPVETVGDGPEVGEVEVDGDRATVEVIDHYDCSTWDEEPEESIDTYHLVVESGEWRVDDVDFAETTSDDCFS